MMSLPTIALLAAVAMSAQDPGEIPGEWDKPPEKAATINDPDAQAAEETRLLQAVAAAEQIGAEHLLLASPLEELGVFYMLSRRSADAEPLFRRALAIREAAQGADHVDLTETLVHLAMCLLYAQGKATDAAEPMLHRALAIREKAFGPESEPVAYVLASLGNFHHAQADDDAAELVARLEGRLPVGSKSERHARLAEQFYERALTIREKVLKPDDPDIARLLYNLGRLAYDRDRPADGEPYLERWFQLQEVAKAPAGEKQADVLEMLAQTSRERKDWAQAERRLAKAQAILEAMDEPDREAIGAVLSDRAVVALKLGRFDDAEVLLKRGLDVQAAVRGPDDPDVVRVRALTAGSYRDHVRDRRAPVLWHQLQVLGDAWSLDAHLIILGDIVNSYVNLLRQTNQVIPIPTEAELESLSKLCQWSERDHEVFHYRWEHCLTKELNMSVLYVNNAELAHIGRLYAIEHLQLIGGSAAGDGRITDAGLAHLKNLLNLRFLSVRGTEITDAGLPHLAGLEDLEELDLGINRLGDAGLIHLKSLKSLRKLRLSATNITDAGLAHLEAMKNLKSLVINSTKVTEAGVERLCRSRPDLQIEYRPGPGYMPLKIPAQPAAEARTSLPAPGEALNFSSDGHCASGRGEDCEERLHLQGAKS